MSTILPRLAAALTLALSTTAVQAQSVHLISYEATSSQQTDVNLEEVSYDARAAIAAQARDMVVPEVLDILGIDPEDASIEVTPGGWMLETNASLQTRAELDGEAADSFAAAAGYVFRQSAVLVTDFGDTEGGTGYAIVSFAEDTLDAGLAQAFFEHAAEVEEGLGGGYTAFGDDMYFLNVHGADGPYSGLEDEAFTDALAQAAESFGDEADLSVSGEAAAHFISHDWTAADDGSDYFPQLGGADSETITALTALRDDWIAWVEDHADEMGYR